MEYENKYYMTPRDFLDSVIYSDQDFKSNMRRRKVSSQELGKMLHNGKFFTKMCSSFDIIIRKAVEILTNELFLFQVPRIYSEMTVNEALSENPQLFRSLGAHGIISYSEYLFLLSLLTRPKRGLRYVLKFTIRTIFNTI